AFLFSSRRRHTRSLRDWSSDVCSSDLTRLNSSQAEDDIRDLYVTRVQTCLGADYTIENGHYCLSKILVGGNWNPEETAPLAAPGLNVHTGDCILAVGGEEIKADDDIQ